jgi:hypothetical protein
LVIFFLVFGFDDFSGAFLGGWGGRIFLGGDGDWGREGKSRRRTGREEGSEEEKEVEEREERRGGWWSRQGKTTIIVKEGMRQMDTDKLVLTA